MKTNFSLIQAVVVIVAIGLLYFTLQRIQQTPPLPEIPYTEFKELLKEGDIGKLHQTGQVLEGELKSAIILGDSSTPSSRFRTVVPAFGDDELLPLLEWEDVTLRVTPESEADMGNRLLSWLPLLLLLFVYLFFLRRMSRNVSGGMGRGGTLDNFLNPGSSDKEGKIPDISFDDVAGQDNAKHEVTELVDYLGNPDSYNKLGAYIPHGLLLMGAPGTGKTLMARALAGEAKVPFFSISASEFVEVFVGVGASRVRRMFAQAKERAPSIIFIDELDSVGRIRGTGLGGGHDEREQTLNQILAEMDGFSGHEAVIVIAATNRPDVLDPALLRPGRFDRHVTLDLPDLDARVAILKVHTRKVPLTDNVSLKEIAAGIPGFSGADIRNLVNEAAMRAARENRRQVIQEDFDEMRDKILMGSVRTLAIQPEERHSLAVHEGGHAIAAYYLPYADPLFKVTIIPRGHTLGATHQLPEQERHTLTKKYLGDRLAVMMGGRVAEKLLLDSISSGADDDIRQATALVRSMVGRWGMSEEIGPMDVRENEEHPFLGREIAQPRRFSEATAQAVDKAVKELLHEAEKRAESIMKSHSDQLETLIASLEKHETLDRDQIEQILEKHALKQVSNMIPVNK
ncbi:MAG: ATP-dependent zinc metalloprotease FtsH [Pseudomonadota bacterium]|nr:ATP-dependent zinc metalloprotease FtsH [Pseudomonadota bacterium]